MPSGIEYMRAIADGTHPPAPIQELMGFDIVEADEGRTLFRSVPGRQHLNPIGVVHGGFAGLLLDSCMGAAVHTTCGEGESYSTLETKFNLVRPILPDTGEVLAEGRVVHRGRRVATAEGTVKRASDGKLLAHGTSTCMIIAADGAG
ncbi:MAG: hypothetical protein QOE69_302 [Thermoleophilaceae bacterium]|jgi:uncharacterized protein (TIGR00369 family)|nr:hypothetical protein [Thermoleophilaceae bacterium]